MRSALSTRIKDALWGGSYIRVKLPSRPFNSFSSEPRLSERAKDLRREEKRERNT